MGQEVGGIFAEVERQAKRLRNETLVYEGARLKREAVKRYREIVAVRAERDQLRRAKRRPDINGTLRVLDMHPLEWAALKLLCPDVVALDVKARGDAWAWCEKQTWFKEFKPPAFDKVMHYEQLCTACARYQGRNQRHRSHGGDRTKLYHESGVSHFS